MKLSPVSVVCTDGFLFPNRELMVRGLMERKGFPESFDHEGLARFLVAVRSGSDTLQSMIAVGSEFRKLGWHTAVIVTDPPHTLRSRTMARANGIQAVTSPTRSGPMVYSRDTEFHYIVRETGGYLYFQLYGRWHDKP